MSNRFTKKRVSCWGYQSFSRVSSRSLSRCSAGASTHAKCDSEWINSRNAHSNHVRPSLLRSKSIRIHRLASCHSWTSNLNSLSSGLMPLLLYAFDSNSLSPFRYYLQQGLHSHEKKGAQFQFYSNFIHYYCEFNCKSHWNPVHLCYYYYYYCCWYFVVFIN